MFTPYFACILVVVLGYVVVYGLIFLAWHWYVAVYLNLSMCVGTTWATYKFEPCGNFQTIAKVKGTSV